MSINCRTQSCKATDDTVEQNINIPIQPVKLALSIALRNAFLLQSQLDYSAVATLSSQINHFSKKAAPLT